MVDYIRNLGNKKKKTIGWKFQFNWPIFTNVVYTCSAESKSGLTPILSVLSEILVEVKVKFQFWPIAGSHFCTQHISWFITATLGQLPLLRWPHPRKRAQRLIEDAESKEYFTEFVQISSHPLDNNWVSPCALQLLIWYVSNLLLSQGTHFAFRKNHHIKQFISHVEYFSSLITIGTCQPGHISWRSALWLQFCAAKRSWRQSATSSKQNTVPTFHSKVNGLVLPTRGPKKWSLSCR